MIPRHLLNFHCHRLYDLWLRYHRTRRGLQHCAPLAAFLARAAFISRPPRRLLSPIVQTLLAGDVLIDISDSSIDAGAACGRKTSQFTANVDLYLESPRDSNTPLTI